MRCSMHSSFSSRSCSKTSLSCPAYDDLDLQLLFVVDTKLEYVINELVHEVEEKALLSKARLLYHSKAHQVQYGSDLCIMGHDCYIIPRLLVGVFIYVLCSYSTLPLHALVTLTGTGFKQSIYNDHVQVGLVRWNQK